MTEHSAYKGHVPPDLHNISHPISYYHILWQKKNDLSIHKANDE